MLSGFFGLAVLIMKLWPTTPTAAWLHRALVELPLELAARVERRHMILLGLLMFGGQLVVIFGSELAFVYALDLSLYGEAVVATAIATAAVRVRYVWERCKALIGIPLRALSAGRTRSRSRRTKVRTTVRNSSANDDDRPGALSLRVA